MLAIFKRELRSYFTNGIGFAYCAFFTLIVNLCYYLNSVQNYLSDFLYIFNIMLIAMIFLIPIMTMRIWSEEKKQKTDQLLLTAPVNTMSIVLGKFLAAMSVFLIGLAITLILLLISATKGTVHIPIFVGNYVAVIFAAAAYIAISQFMSSLTESQIVSALLSMLTLSLFFFLNFAFGVVENDIIANILKFLSIITRFYNFYRGIFALDDIIYFVSLTGLFLFLTSRVVEKRRWS